MGIRHQASGCTALIPDLMIKEAEELEERNTPTRASTPFVHVRPQPVADDYILLD
jgi:hypothetical protein